MRTVDYNMYALSEKEKYFLVCVLGAALLVTGNLFFHSMLPVFLLPVFWKKVKSFYMEYAGEKRKKALLLQYRDLLYELSSSFSSGRHMEEALQESREKLRIIYPENADILLETEAMTEGIRRGKTDLEVWEDFSLRAGIDEIEEFVMVFRVCRETGGDFISVLNRAAGLIGEKIILENEIRTMMIQKENEGLIILAMPFILLLFLRITSPGYLSPLYSTFTGRLVMAFALVLVIAAGKMIKRIVKVEI